MLKLQASIFGSALAWPTLKRSHAAPKQQSVPAETLNLGIDDGSSTVNCTITCLDDKGDLTSSCSGNPSSDPTKVSSLMDLSYNKYNMVGSLYYDGLTSDNVWDNIVVSTAT